MRRKEKMMKNLSLMLGMLLIAAGELALAAAIRDAAAQEQSSGNSSSTTLQTPNPGTFNSPGGGTASPN
jgi:hypothetical protein